MTETTRADVIMATPPQREASLKRPRALALEDDDDATDLADVDRAGQRPSVVLRWRYEDEDERAIVADVEPAATERARADAEKDFPTESNELAMNAFDDVAPGADGVRRISNPPEDRDEDAHERRLASRKPGDVWALYEHGTGLPRWYVQLLAADESYLCNDRPARWRVVLLDRDARANVGCHWHEEGVDMRWKLGIGGKWKGWSLANCGDAIFSHPASACEHVARAAAKFRCANDASGNGFLIPWNHPAAFIEPRPQQAWAMTSLPETTDSGRTMRASDERQYVVIDGVKKMLASEDIVLVTEVRRSVVLENEYGIAEMKERVETTSFTVERLAPIASDVDGAERENVAGAYRRTGALVVVEAKHFDFQVLVNGEETTPEGTTLRLDTFALQVVRDDDIEIEDGDDFVSYLSSSDEEEARETARTKRKKRSRFHLEPSTPYSKYPSCARCREVEWHHSKKSPGEPHHCAPVVLRCGDCGLFWHVQCIAPSAIPGDAHAFAAGGDGCPWTCERCRVYAKGDTPADALALSNLCPDNAGCLGWEQLALATTLLEEWNDDDARRPYGQLPSRLVARVRFESDAGRKTSEKWVAWDVVEKLPDAVLAGYLRDDASRAARVTAAVGSERESASSGIYPEDEEIAWRADDGDAGERKSTKRVWRFRSNGQYFGVTQYLHAFDDDELEMTEKAITELIDRERASGDAPHVHVGLNGGRIKVFFGYRYTYDSVTAPKLIADAPPIQSWVHSTLGNRAKIIGAIDKNVVIDNAVVNLYARSKARLSVHMDPSALFKRPIVSARFFGDGVLSFGAKGQYEGQRIHSVPLTRGSIAVMEGYAANMVTHAVNERDVVGRGCSFMLRSCQPDAMEDAERRKKGDAETAELEKIDSIMRKIEEERACVQDV